MVECLHTGVRTFTLVPVETAAAAIAVFGETKESSALLEALGFDRPAAWDAEEEGEEEDEGEEGGEEDEGDEEEDEGASGGECSSEQTDDETPSIAATEEFDDQEADGSGRSSPEGGTEAALGGRAPWPAPACPLKLPLKSAPPFTLPYSLHLPPR